MRTYDFVCLEHPEEVHEVRAGSLGEVDVAERICSHCGQEMERFFGRAAPQVALQGANWPKRDIKETARRKRRSEVLGRKQEKVWKPLQPKLNLDPDVQKEFRDHVTKGGAPLTVKKL